MAEINIEKKKPVWPWILALLLLALIAAAIIFLDFDGDDKELEEVAYTEQVEVEKTQEKATMETKVVNEFLMKVRNEEGKMGLDHVYTHNSLTLLANALKQTAENLDYDVEQDLSMVKEKADKITKDPMSLEHADQIKKAFGSIYATFQHMQEAKFPNMANEVAELKEYHDKLDPAVPTLEQKPHVKGFFDQAAVLLKNMNNL